MNLLRILKILCECLIEKDKVTDNALLTEYQVCHKEKHSQASTYWTIVGIFLSVTTVVAGYLFSSILKGELIYDDTKWQIFWFSVLALAIIIFLGLWLKRTGVIIDTANRRMKKIEDMLGMQLNHRIKKELNESKFCKFLPGKYLLGKYIAGILFTLISIPWILLTIAAVCPKIGQLIFVQ